nr:MAG: hypothetical protein 2 [Sichuan sediment noda-like virus 13]
MPNKNAKTKANNPNAARSGTAANSRRRNRRPKNQALVPTGNKPRTPGTIISALTARTKMLLIDVYECCRLTGQPPKVSPSIPDGANGKHICVCLFAIDRITPGAAKSIELQFNPWFPAFGAAYASDKFAVNGNTYVPSPGLVVPIGVIPNFASILSSNTYPGSLTNGLDPYVASGMRIVSQTHKIEYTGPVTTCAGMLRGFSNPWVLSAAGETTKNTSAPAGDGWYGTVYDQNATQVTVTNKNTPFLFIDGTRNIAALPSNTVSLRPEQGMLVRLNHRSGAFKTQPVKTPLPNLVSFPVTNNAASVEIDSAFSIFTTSPPATSAGYGGGISAYDNDWEGVHVTLDNINADASYSITTCVCVEFQPQTSSTFYPLAKNAVAPQPQRIAHVDKVIADSGVVIPLSDPR